MRNHGRRCRSPFWWFEVGESSILGPEIINEALEKVRVIRDRLATTYSPTEDIYRQQKAAFRV